MRSDRNPFRNVLTLREAMDRLLEDSFVQPLRSVVGTAAGGPPLDLMDMGDRFLLRAAVPGIQPDALHVQIQGDVLTLRGTTPGVEEVEAGGGAAREGRGRRLIRELDNHEFEREIRLPDDVVAENVEARVEHGMLTLTLPKARTVGPRRIEIGPRAAQSEGERQAQQNNPSVVDPTKPEVAPGVMPARERSLASDTDRPHKDQVTVESEQSF